MRRTLLLVAGVVLAVAGLALAQSPSIAPGVEAPDLAPTLVAVLAMLAGLVRARSWLGHDPSETTPVERERRSAVAVPGDEFDGRLRNTPAVGATAGDTRLLSVRQRLREAAVDVLESYQGYTEEEAQDALDAGTWTDDRIAAEFFTTRSGTGNSASEALKGTFYGRGPFYRRATRAASELERLTRGASE